MSETSFLPPPADDVSPAGAVLVGVSSPLWGYYLSAAASGVAWWWMTRWAELANLEAMFGAAERASAKAFEGVEPATGAALATVAATAEGVVETVAEAANDTQAQVVEAAETGGEALETVAESATSMVEPFLPPEPVGGEAAPISPILEAASADADAEPKDEEPGAA